MSIDIGTAASITTDTVRRLAPLAPELGAFGMTLYHWSKDTKPGDRTGDGFNNAWRLAKP
jgi:hypothetical protein